VDSFPLSVFEAYLTTPITTNRKSDEQKEQYRHKYERRCNTCVFPSVFGTTPTPLFNQLAACDRFHSQSLPVVCMMMHTEQTCTHRLTI